MRTAEITLTVECPGAHISNEDFAEWIQWELGIKDDISLENALEFAELSNYIKSNKITVKP